MPTTQRGSDTPVRSVLRRWDVGVAEPRDAVPAGRGWRIQVPGGSLLLRDYGPVEHRPDRRRIGFQHSVTAALDRAGLPVPGPLVARNGRTLVQAAGRLYALFPWIDGTRRGGLELSLTQCRELGGVLGRLHSALDDLTPPVQQTLVLPTPRAAEAVAAIDALLAAPPGTAGPEADARAARLLDERRALLTELADHQPPEVEAVAIGYLHGDFHAGQLLYGTTRRVIGVLGWDELTTGPIAGEVVRAAVLLFAHDDERGLDLDRVQAFVHGHAETFRAGPGPLDAAQIQSAVHRLWWERLCDVGLLGRGHPRRDPPGRHRFSAGSALVTWWTAHLDRTLEVFAAPYLAGDEESAEHW